MGVKENKAAVYGVVEEAINKGNLEVLDAIMTPDYVYHFPMMEINGPEGFKGFVTMMRTAFPDINVKIEDIVSEGDMAAVRMSVRGTFMGEMMGIAPTGKQLDFTEAVFIRFEGGKEAEAIPFADMLSYYQQLGVPIPSK